MKRTVYIASCCTSQALRAGLELPLIYLLSAHKFERSKLLAYDFEIIAEAFWMGDKRII